MEEEVAAGEENAMGKQRRRRRVRKICVLSVICNGEKRYGGKNERLLF